MSTITCSKPIPKTTPTGRQSGWIVELRHEELGEVKYISGSEMFMIDAKIDKQVASWEEKYRRLQERQSQADRAAEAEERTREAREQIQAIEGLLAHTLEIDDAVDWDKEKNTSEFDTPRPKPPKKRRLEAKPSKKSFQKEIPFSAVILGRKKKTLLEQEEKYQDALRKWEEKKSKAEEDFQKSTEKYEAALEVWEKLRQEYENSKARFNEKLDVLREEYEHKGVEAVIEYCEIVLENSSYPDSFPKNFEMQYSEASGMLIVDFQLPAPDDMPKIEQVRYIKSRDEFSEKLLSEAARKRLYESAVYQVALRTIHELFEADKVDALQAVTFNGRVDAIDPGTGHMETKCIVSVQAEKSEFCAINLSAVDPKTCFKALKGVGSTKISSVTPIRPILELDKTDRRFRDHHEVAHTLDESTNLAAMDWEEFEHLVREVFEKEFAQAGGEVKVTQASSDGGIDAVAFDPDPIRGGKIVIQAKRYTNIVGVAAVRDLYGTVLNEGATKGILVTTSDYGADSYKFAADKPLTLMSGANLLHLLEKHGHRAKIDIQEARLVRDR